MDTNNLIVWLPFDASTTTDHCGGEWTAFGEPVIRDGTLYLDGSSYIKRAEKFEFAGQPFTVSCKFSGTSNTTGGAVALWQMHIGGSNRFHISINTNGKIHLWKDTDSTINITSAASVLDGQIHHAECDFDGATWYLFLDGVLIGTKAHTCTARNYSLYVGTNYSQGREFTGTIDEFMIYDGVALHTENFTPPTDDDYFNLKLAEFGSVATAETADFERITRNKPNIEVDACYMFDGTNSSRATLPLEVLAGATEFTIEIKFATTSTGNKTNNYDWDALIGRNFASYWHNETVLCVNDGKLCFWTEPQNNGSSETSNTLSDVVVNDGAIHTAAVRSNADGSIDLFCDGEHIAHTDNVNAKLPDTYEINIAYNGYNSASRLPMDFYEARLWRVARDEIFADIDGSEDGLEAWYLPTPAGIVDYSTHIRNATIYNATYSIHVNQTADIERILINGAIAWRYEDRVVYIGSGNPISFHIPRVAELWAKFSVYFDGLNRWYASDSNANGLTAQKSRALDFTANDASVDSFANICTPLRTQEFLLHMKAGIVDGLIEAWADNEHIGLWSGNVNNGLPFEEFALRSDDSGTSFTDLIVSNQSLLPTDKPSATQGTYQFTHLNLKHYTFEFTASSYAVSHINLTQKIHAVTQIFKPINSIWIKFDVTSDGVNSWRAYSDGVAGQCGVAALLGVDFFANDSDVAIAPDICNGKQTFILHMESDTSDGLIELYCDGQLVGSYSGNVNDGNEFTDVYLTSESDAAVFDNFIVSSDRLTFDATPVDVQDDSELPTLSLNIFHAGKVLTSPLRFEPSAPAITIRKFGVAWFAPLSENNSPVKISLGGQVLSLGR